MREQSWRHFSPSRYQLPVVCELQINPKIFTLEKRHGRLKVILASADIEQKQG